MQVSIIIPIYDAEKYLKRCLDSVLQQSCKDIEIILVDDGSKDECPAICEAYREKDSRIKVFHIKNCGQSAARNIGMESATGKYISFVDADDVLAEGAIETLLSIAEEGKYDIVSGSYYRVNKKIKISSNCYSSGDMNKYGCKEHKKRYNLYKTSSSFGYVWGKLYRASFINDHKLRFYQDKKVFMEDTLFNLKAVSFNPKYYVLNKPVYYYYVYQSSTSNKKEDVTQKAINMMQNYQCFLRSQCKYEENLDLFVPLAARILCWVIFKKIQSEGLSFNNIYNTIIEFSNFQPVVQLFSHRKAIRVLMELPNFLETVFFTVCILAFRFKLYKILSAVFICIYPGCKVYIKRNVKR